MPTSDRWICPECEQGKHGNCNGDAWDFDADEKVPCQCPPEFHAGAVSDHPSAPDDLRAERVAKNTDREIWRKGGGDGNGMSYYEPTINVTAQDEIAIGVGGMVYVKPVEEWHRLAALPVLAADREGEVAEAAEEAVFNELEELLGETFPDDHNQFDGDEGYMACFRAAWFTLARQRDEAREQLAVERGKVAAVRAACDDYWFMTRAGERVVPEQHLRSILADPGQWEAEVKAAALREAADAADSEWVGLKPEGWGSNDADRQTIDFAKNARDWLRARADRVADGGES